MTGLREVVHFSFPFLVHFCIPVDIRRFCQHVLPSGFMKVRYYGFMNPASSISMDKIAQCIARALALAKPAAVKLPSRIWPKCTDCGGRLIYYASIIAFHLPASGTR